MTSDAVILAASQRPLPQHARPDLEATPVRFGQQPYWNVKDPLTLRYFQLQDVEYFILNLLNGKRSLEEIQQQVEQKFSPQKVDLSHLQAFIGMLHREGLVLVDTSDQGARLLERRRRLRFGQWTAALANPLAIRFRGVDPTPLLDGLYRRLSWLFRPWILAASTMVILSAVILLATEYQTVQAKLPTVRAFLSVTNVAWLAAALCGVKLLHELAHGLVCRHYGAECHEAGVMLLVGVPCLYCDVSDAWMLPSKWNRIAISAAGIWLELTLAAVCSVVWCFSTPGPLGAVCFNIMAICSVGTLLLNGNPLLRFDGYYILADWMEIPNLWQQANGRLGQTLARLFLGIDLPEGRLARSDRPVFLLAYGIASFVYRVLVIAGILWLCLMFFSQRRLEPVGQLIVALVLGGLVFAWGTSLWRRVHDPRWAQRVQRSRVVWSTACTALVVAAVLFIPLPRRIRVPVTLVPAAAERVYVELPGVLQWAVAPAEMLEQGQPVARLRDVQMEQEIERVSQQLRLQSLVVEQLQRRRIRDARAAAELPAAEELRDALKEWLSQQKRRQQKLTLLAPRSGTVMLPRHRKSQSPPSDLPRWSGTPLDPENVGCLLEANTLVCLVGDPNRLEGLAIVDQGDVGAVRAGQPFRLQLDAMPGRLLRGHVEELEELDLSEVPPELVATKKLAIGTDAAPARTSYRARLAVGRLGQPLLLGATGTAMIDVDQQSLGRRLWRAVRRTFQFSPPFPITE